MAKCLGQDIERKYGDEISRVKEERFFKRRMTNMNKIKSKTLVHDKPKPEGNKGRNFTPYRE